MYGRHCLLGPGNYSKYFGLEAEGNSDKLLLGQLLLSQHFVKEHQLYVLFTPNL
jgi:hypothetical protein